MSQDSSRESLGWTPWHEAHWHTLITSEDGAAVPRFPARVVGEERGLRRLQTSLLDTFWGETTGNARRDLDLYPAVGDWVVCSRGPMQERASIHAVLPRR